MLITAFSILFVLNTGTDPVPAFKFNTDPDPDSDTDSDPGILVTKMKENYLSKNVFFSFSVTYAFMH